MPRKYFRKYLPTQETFMRYRWGRALMRSRLHHPNLWHLHRRSVAAGVAVGLFAGLVPGPLQMVSAALLAVLFRANLPVAVFVTLYTNPLTIVPLYALAYEYGAFLLGQHGRAPAKFEIPDWEWSNWTEVLPHWFLSLGKPFALGLPMLALTLALVGYVTVRILWRLEVSWEWQRRIKKRKLDMNMDNASLQTATFAGGCFWCLEAVFEQVRGVSSVVSGYTGGHLKNPGYEAVCTGETGHAEAVQLSFDSNQVSYEELLALFFSLHDPTTLNRQGNDVGTQYRSAIFLHSAAQRKEAEKMIAGLNEMHIWKDPIVTELAEAQPFYRAEDFHQHFYANNPDQGYCQVVIAPKLAQFRAHFRKLVK